MAFSEVRARWATTVFGVPFRHTCRAPVGHPLADEPRRPRRDCYGSDLQEDDVRHTSVDRPGRATAHERVRLEPQHRLRSHEDRDRDRRSAYPCGPPVGDGVPALQEVEVRERTQQRPVKGPEDRPCDEAQERSRYDP